jgi:branched-subunit amino acid ABC-type transport system permease component
MISYLSIILLSFTSAAFAQQPTPVQSVPPAVSTNGFNDGDTNLNQTKESWLKQNDRYVFIIVLALLVLAVLIWYIARSIRGMRQRLSTENQGHMMMMQGGGNGFKETIPVDNNGFHKMPDYSASPPQQNQQQHTHRY